MFEKNIESVKRKLDDNIIIRKAKLEDANSIAVFNMKMAEETERKKIDRDVVIKGVQAVLNDSNKGFYLVAEKMNKLPMIVGQLMITYEWSDWRNKNFWWIQSVYIERKHRNKKIFSNLYSTVLEIAKSRNDVAGLRLYVESHNETAKNVYKSLGMKKNYDVYEIEF